ncbi:MAG: TolC family protein, partial [Alphaproteobacteria bacterium]
MNRLRKFPGLCAIALLVAAGMSNPASAQGLKESLAAAYINNPTLQAARNQLRATDEQVPQARSNYFPTVTSDTTAGRNWLQQQAVFGVGAVLNPREESLVVSEPVYRGGRTQAEIDKAENLVKAGREQLTVTEQNVMLAAATAYMDVYRDQAVLDLNINNEQVLRRQLEATQDQFRVGEVTRTDVSQAEARLAQATAARIQAEGTLNSSRAVYRNVTGISPTKLDEPDGLQGLPGTADESIAASVQNPAVLFASFNEQAARNDIDINF